MSYLIVNVTPFVKNISLSKNFSKNIVRSLFIFVTGKLRPLESLEYIVFFFVVNPELDLVWLKRIPSARLMYI